MKFLTFLATLLGLGGPLPSGAAEVPKIPEHAVIIHFKYGSPDLSRLFELEKKLEVVVAKAKVGEYDGHEIAIDGSDGILYLYGPNADKLFNAIEPVLRNSPFILGAEVKKRYGEAGQGAKEVAFRIGGK